MTNITRDKFLIAAVPVMPGANRAAAVPQGHGKVMN
jgi:hypothetical protein